MVLIELIDDEFMEIGSSAKIYDKNEVIRWLRSEDNKSELVGVDFNAKFLAEDVVLLTYISSNQEKHLAESKMALRASIWRRVEGNWRMVFHQGTTMV